MGFGRKRDFPQLQGHYPEEVLRQRILDGARVADPSVQRFSRHRGGEAENQSRGQPDAPLRIGLGRKAVVGRAAARNVLKSSSVGDVT